LFRSFGLLLDVVCGDAVSGETIPNSLRQDFNTPCQTGRMCTDATYVISYLMAVCCVIDIDRFLYR
jgi:hypothetical protein